MDGGFCSLADHAFGGALVSLSTGIITMFMDWIEGDLGCIWHAVAVVAKMDIQSNPSLSAQEVVSEVMLSKIFCIACADAIKVIHPISLFIL